MDNNIAFKEKRTFERIELPTVTANFNVLNLRSYSTYLEKTPKTIENLSLGGISLKAKDLFEQKCPIAIDLKIGSDNYLMRIFGRIAWVKPVENDDYLMGVSFSWWDNDEDKKRVRELIVQQKFRE